MAEKISLLHNSHLSETMQLIKDAIAKMNELGIPQWDNTYPDLDTITNDAHCNQLYGIWQEEKIAGIMALNEWQDPTYKKVVWRYDDPSPLILHRLTISPQFQGRGLAKKMILFMEEFAKKENYKSIRLDTFIQNPISVNLYRKMDYEERGIVDLRMGPFYVFEKGIK